MGPCDILSGGRSIYEELKNLLGGFRFAGSLLLCELRLVLFLLFETLRCVGTFFQGFGVCWQLFGLC